MFLFSRNTSPMIQGSFAKPCRLIRPKRAKKSFFMQNGCVPHFFFLYILASGNKSDTPGTHFIFTKMISHQMLPFSQNTSPMIHGGSGKPCRLIRLKQAKKSFFMQKEYVPHFFFLYILASSSNSDTPGTHFIFTKIISHQKTLFSHFPSPLNPGILQKSCRLIRPKQPKKSFFMQNGCVPGVSKNRLWYIEGHYSTAPWRGLQGARLKVQGSGALAHLSRPPQTSVQTRMRQNQALRASEWTLLW